jgi:hypothetical protein
MDLDLHVLQGARDGDGVVVAGIIDDDNEIDDSLRHDFVVGPPQRARGVVRWHNDNNFLAVEHSSRNARARRSFGIRRGAIKCASGGKDCRHWFSAA